MATGIDIEDFRKMPDDQKWEAIFRMFNRTNDALNSIPDSSLGINEVRQWFDNNKPYPTGYALANGSKGTFNPGTVPIVLLQKVT